MMPSPMKPTFAMPIASVSDRLDAVRAPPAETFVGPALRLVLAADPAVVADRVEEAEQETIIDFAGARFIAPRIVGELHVRDLRAVGLERIRELAFHPLHVVDVVLHVQVRRPGVANDIERLLR